MKKIGILFAIMAIVTATIFIGCNKDVQVPLKDKGVVVSNEFQPLTGGNGNGTNPYSREFEISELTNKATCIEDGSNCKIKASSSVYSNVETFQTYLASGDVASYFQNENWHILFGELSGSQIDELISGEMEIFEIDNDNSHPGYALRNSGDPIDNIQFVWMFYPNIQAFAANTSAAYTREITWTNDPTGGDDHKMDCVAAGTTCDVGEKPKTETDKLEGHIVNGTVDAYFESPTWPLLFPIMTDEDQALVIEGGLNVYNIPSVEADDMSFVVSSASTAEEVEQSNIFYTCIY